MSFLNEIKKYNWDQVTSEIDAKNSDDVYAALNKPGVRNLEDFKSLISPAAEPVLEKMAVLSRQMTRKRFGKTLQMYIPLYLSNKCDNQCLYCGFSRTNSIPRKTLTEAEIMDEIRVIKKYGFEHVLIVTGESPAEAGMDYLLKAVRLLRDHFSSISMEVQPLEKNDYQVLIKEGLTGVYIYQETYNPCAYQICHKSGKKRLYDYRLETPERIGNAGMYRIGLGFLAGLDDWRTEAFYTALHLLYLEKHYWKTRFSLSFPRLRPSMSGFQPRFLVSDKNIVQLICAYRIFNENAELSLSTRESPLFRDNVMHFGITNISAGSKIAPGGYSGSENNLEQFDISDDRSPALITEKIRKLGYEPVWKDWDHFLTPQKSSCF